MTRKNIARVLTVLNQRRKELLRKKYKQAKYKPLDLRPKLTRRLRKRIALKPYRNLKTPREMKKLRHYPAKRVYAVKL